MLFLDFPRRIKIHRLNGQSTAQPAHLLPLVGFLLLPSQEHLHLPIRMTRRATMTMARTTNNTMTVGRFMQ